MDQNDAVWRYRTSFSRSYVTVAIVTTQCTMSFGEQLQFHFSLVTCSDHWGNQSVFAARLEEPVSYISLQVFRKRTEIHRMGHVVLCSLTVDLISHGEVLRGLLSLQSRTEGGSTPPRSCSSCDILFWALYVEKSQSGNQLFVLHGTDF